MRRSLVALDARRLSAREFLEGQRGAL